MAFRPNYMDERLFLIPLAIEEIKKKGAGYLLYLRILALVFIAAGFSMVFAAGFIVKRYKLDKNAECEFEDEMTEQEIELYKFRKATVNFKMLGMLVALPGLILFIILFR